MIKQTIEFMTNTRDLRVSRELSTALKRWQSQTLNRLQQEPGPVKYPIRWTSERQRRAYFATKGFGRGIPTRRTHELSQSWDVMIAIDQITRYEQFKVALLDFMTKFGVGSTPTPPPASIWVSVSNPVDYEQYVTGIHQQGFHQDTGWYQSVKVIDSAFQQLEGIVDTL